MTEQASTYSIYSHVVHGSHREFYEEIMARLRGVGVVYTLGRCKSLEVARSRAEQAVIDALMDDAERLSDELSKITRRLFAQFYQDKEEFYRWALASTAACKIDLIDRNLLERTCDVRWWSLEMAFCDCLAHLTLTRDRMEEFAAELERLSASQDTQAGDDSVRTLTARLTAGASVTAGGCPTYCLPRRGGDVVDALQALSGDTELADSVRRQATFLAQELQALHRRIEYACERLEDIVSAYTLYRDLVITDAAGIVVANANRARRDDVLGTNVSAETWFQRALATRDGTEYFAQDVSASVLEPCGSLVYSTAVRRDGETKGAVLGTMGVFFDFQDEASRILRDYMPRDGSGGTRPGWYSFITNASGTVIGTSDPDVIPPNTRQQCTATADRLAAGESCSRLVTRDGGTALVASARTAGYLEYPGLGWTCHALMPEADIFEYHESSHSTADLDVHRLTDSRLVPDVNKEAYALTRDTQGGIQDISINGIIIANRIGPQAKSLTPVFDAITQATASATRMMEKLDVEMARDQLDHTYEALRTLAKQAIDLIDRNLFERAADVRWWATDRAFHRAMDDPSPEAFEQACARLAVINQSYTMYRNLVLIDRRGTVVASSNPALRANVHGVPMQDVEWFTQCLKSRRSSDYLVVDVADSALEPTQARSLIYTAAVRAGGARSGAATGAIAIMFDWQQEARQMLTACLPKNADGSPIAGCFAVYTNRDGVVIEATEAHEALVGTTLDLPAAHLGLEDGETIGSVVTLGEQTCVVGSARTQGYREYRGMAWSAHVLRPFD